MSMGISISIIIVNYNSGEFLRDCINSLFPSPIEMEVIVVDNASSDGSLNTIDAK